MATSTHLAVVVFHPSPFPRHAAIYIDFSDGRPAWRAQLVGCISADLHLWTGEARIMDECAAFARHTSLGFILIEREELMRLLYATPIDFWDPHFDGRHWIERVLRQLVHGGYLSASEYARGVSTMARAENMTQRHDSHGTTM